MTESNWRPQMIDEITMCPDESSDKVIVVNEITGKCYRLSASVAAALNKLNGSRSVKQVAEDFDLDDTATSELQKMMEQLAKYGLLKPNINASGMELSAGLAVGKGALSSPVKLKRYLRDSTLTSIKFTFFDPSIFLSKASFVHRFALALSSWRVMIFLALLLVTLSIYSRTVLLQSVSTPVSILTVMFALATVLFANVLHELAHGFVLSALGGRVRRMGFMLMYGAPAFFCDVTDAWRLKRRRRLQVALAGICLNAWLATISLLALILLNDGSEDLHQFLAIICVLQIFMIIINAIPFVKFDGYVALALYLDIPHLRNKSLTVLRKCVDCALFGRKVIQEGSPSLFNKKETLLAVYGLFCLLTGIGLSLWALMHYLPMVASLNAIAGLVFRSLVMTAIVYMLSKALFDAYARAARSGVSRMRCWAVLVVLCGVVGLALGSIPVTRTQTLPYVVRDGQAYLLASSTESASINVSKADRIVFNKPGLLLQNSQGQGSVCGPAKAIETSIDSSTPILKPWGDTEMQFTAFPLCFDNKLATSVVSRGYARIDYSAENLGSAIKSWVIHG